MKKFVYGIVLFSILATIPVFTNPIIDFDFPWKVHLLGTDFSTRSEGEFWGYATSEPHLEISGDIGTCSTSVLFEFGNDGSRSAELTRAYVRLYLGSVVSLSLGLMDTPTSSPFLLRPYSFIPWTNLEHLIWTGNAARAPGIWSGILSLDFYPVLCEAAFFPFGFPVLSFDPTAPWFPNELFPHEFSAPIIGLRTLNDVHWMEEEIQWEFDPGFYLYVNAVLSDMSFSIELYRGTESFGTVQPSIYLNNNPLNTFDLFLEPVRNTVLGADITTEYFPSDGSLYARIGVQTGGAVSLYDLQNPSLGESMIGTSTRLQFAAGGYLLHSLQPIRFTAETTITGEWIDGSAEPSWNDVSILGVAASIPDIDSEIFTGIGVGVSDGIFAFFADWTTNFGDYAYVNTSIGVFSSDRVMTMEFPLEVASFRLGIGGYIH